MDAFFGEANFVTKPGGIMTFLATVYYETSPGLFGQESRVDVPLQDNDTGQTFNARLLAAVDAEAQRIGIPAAPTRIFGMAITKFR